MARWHKAPRRKRRRGRFPPWLALLLLISCGYIGYLWWLRSQQRDGGSATSVAEQQSSTTEVVARPRTVDPVVTTPEFYGTPSARITIGPGITARLVDRPDSNLPIVLILPSPEDEVAAWAGVQSTLEQFGVASLVISPSAGAGKAVEWVAQTARRRSQPMALLSAGSAFSSALDLGSGSSLADRPLVVLSPPAPGHSPFDAVHAKLPNWLRKRLGARRDERLAGWRGRVLVVRARDEPRFDAVAANLLVAGAPRALVLVTAGAGFHRAPLHPDQESWRAIADFIRGVEFRRRELVVPTQLPSDSTPPSPADTLPPPPL